MSGEENRIVTEHREECESLGTDWGVAEADHPCEGVLVYRAASQAGEQLPRLPVRCHVSKRGGGGCPAPDAQLRVDSNELEILLSDVSTFLLAVPVLPAGHHRLQLDIEDKEDM